MNVLLLTVGSHGDVHPFMDIAAALQRAGHTATLATNPHYQPQIEGSGLAFAALGAPMDIRDVIREQPVMDSLRGPLTVMRTLLLPEVPALVRRMRELIRELKPDVVVHHPILFGAPWACELEGGVRTVSVSPSPLLWGNPNDALVMQPLRSANPSRFGVRVDLAVGGFVLRWALDPALNRMRRELGLPPLRGHLSRGATQADLNLGIWSPLLRGPLEGDPRNACITGFTWHDRDHTQETPDAELQAFLNAGEPPIVFALGSTGVHAPGAFFEHAVQASQRLGARALLVVGRQQPAPRNMPADARFKAVAYAPFSTVFPRASVVVHHGGAGTTAQALRSGRPALVTPMAHDQFDNAARVQRVQAGHMLRFKQVTTGRMVEALQRLRTDQTYQHGAERMAAGLANEDGARVAASRIVTG